MSMYAYKAPATSVAEKKLRNSVERYHTLRLRYGLFLGRTAALIGVRKAARRAGVKPSTAAYWKRKAEDGAFHPAPWGGSRANSMAFASDAADAAVQHVVYEAILDDPDVSFRGLLQKVRSVPGLETMTPWWLSTTIKSWGWDWATTRTVARNKYTDENIIEWVNYAVRVLDIPLNQVLCVWLCIVQCPRFKHFAKRQLIFVDEAKFAINKLGRARKVGPRSHERVVIEHRPNEKRFNMLLMTTLAVNDDPLFFELRDNTVNAEVFLAFIETAIRQGRVPPGSIIVWDNARIHCADATLQALDRVIAAAGSTRVNLPCYSPEFNPCEFVFAEVKTFLRSNPRPGWNLRDRTLEAVGSVSPANVLSYYQHCTRVALDSWENKDE